jgi:hypothetical protein
MIASLAAARRDPLKARLTDRPWDLVIADEAHRRQLFGLFRHNCVVVRLCAPTPAPLASTAILT